MLQLLMKCPGQHVPCQGMGGDSQGETRYFEYGARAGFIQGESLYPLTSYFARVDCPDVAVKASLALASKLWRS